MRIYHKQTFCFFRDGPEDIRRAASEESGCEISIPLSDGYPAVWNHEDLYETVRSGLEQDTLRLLQTPVLGAEDFSFYQKEVPGIYFFFGSGDSPELHVQNFNFDDEAVLPAGR